MGAFARLVFGVFLFSTGTWATDPYRELLETDIFDELEWGGGSVSVSGCTAKNKEILKQDVEVSCGRLRRALYLMENHDKELRQMFARGPNFKVYFANKDFYQTRVRRRLKACDSGNLWLKCMGSGGRCSSDRGTEAYVLVTLGYVGWTIHLCDLYFKRDVDGRPDTMVHEFGRLEDIDTSPTFDPGTNHIYTWDAIVGGLGNPNTFRQITGRNEP